MPSNVKKYRCKKSNNKTLKQNKKHADALKHMQKTHKPNVKISNLEHKQRLAGRLPIKVKTTG